MRLAEKGGARGECEGTAERAGGLLRRMERIDVTRLVEKIGGGSMVEIQEEGFLVTSECLWVYRVFK